MGQPRRHTTPPARDSQDGPLPLRRGRRIQGPSSLAPTPASHLTEDISYAGHACTQEQAPAGARLPSRRQFLSHVTASGGCWLWTGPQHHNGYGYICLRGQKQPLFAHRVSYELFIGPIPRGKSVLHRCDVRDCVSPAHLFLGTQTDNMRDAANKGRLRRQLRRPRRVLTEGDIAEAVRLRTTGATYVELATRFDVAWLTVWRALKGRTWKHAL